MEHFTVLVAPGRCRICSGANFIFQRFPQHYLPSDLFFLQFDFWHFYQEVWLMFSPLKLSGLFWLFQLTEYYRNDTVWFLKLDHKRQCSFIFFCWKARLDCETCSHYVSSPAVLRPSCCEARPQGRALSLPDPCCSSSSSSHHLTAAKWETLNQNCPAKSSWSPDWKIVKWPLLFKTKFRVICYATIDN